MIAVGERRAWTRQRWLGVAAAVMALQVAAVGWLARPPTTLPARSAFATRVHLISPSGADAAIASSLYDPALFALPSRRGFSGAAWLNYPTIKPAHQDRAVTPEWLRLSPAALGGELGHFLATNAISPPLLVDEPLPQVLRYETSLAAEPVAPVSRLRVEGELARRVSSESVQLPSWTHTEIVSNTVVRAAVDAAGRTFSAVLLSRSGLTAADDYAVRFVERIRLAPGTGTGGSRNTRAELAWGSFVFLWHTVPPAPTNAAGIQP